jgi:spore germination protein YaaH
MSLLRKPLAALVVAGALVFSGPAPAGAKVATGCAKTYTVVPNDSWNRIASKVNVTMSLLLTTNSAKTTTLLLIGDVICLPKSATTKDPSTALKLKPPAKRYSVKQSTAIIREIWPDKLENRAIAIAKRESKLNAAAYNGSCCLGLFQIHWLAHRSWLKNIGITSPQQLLDARVNAKAGYAIYKRSNGWGAWN